MATFKVTQIAKFERTVLISADDEQQAAKWIEKGYEDEVIEDWEFVEMIDAMLDIEEMEE
jgi:hypothetical protein